MQTDPEYLQLLDWAWAQTQQKPFTVWLLDERDQGRSLRDIREDLKSLTDGAVAVSPTTLSAWEKRYRVGEVAA